MKLTFLKAKYGIDYELPKSFEKVLRKTFKEKSNLGVFCAVQFRHRLDELREWLKENNYTSETSKAFRTSIEGQILGCDSYADSIKLDLNNIDGFIYVGDGYFHPNALLLAQEYETEIKPVIVINVVQQIVEVIDKSHIEKYLKKKKGNLMKFHTSNEIGVFISTKWGQEYMNSALKLEKQYPEKNFYFFIGDNFIDNEMENFPYVECWVNSACPRIGQDDVVRHKKPVVNLKDVFLQSKNEK